MNNFISDINQKEYFLKLIPDLSIFDVIEKYHIENNKDDGLYEDKLYFYFNNYKVATNFSDEDSLLEYVKNKNPHNTNCMISFKPKDLENSKDTIQIECLEHGEENVNKYASFNKNILFKRFILKTDDLDLIILNGNSFYNFKIGNYFYYIFISNSDNFEILVKPENLYVGVCF